MLQVHMTATSMAFLSLGHCGKKSLGVAGEVLLRSLCACRCSTVVVQARLCYPTRVVLPSSMCNAAITLHTWHFCCGVATMRGAHAVLMLRVHGIVVSDATTTCATLLPQCATTAIVHAALLSLCVLLIPLHATFYGSACNTPIFN